jgi:hypothetical protein
MKKSMRRSKYPKKRPETVAAVAEDHVENVDDDIPPATQDYPPSEPEDDPIENADDGAAQVPAKEEPTQDADPEATLPEEEEEEEQASASEDADHDSMLGKRKTVDDGCDRKSPKTTEAPERNGAVHTGHDPTNTQWYDMLQLDQWPLNVFKPAKGNPVIKFEAATSVVTSVLRVVSWSPGWPGYSLATQTNWVLSASRMVKLALSDDPYKRIDRDRFLNADGTPKPGMDWYLRQQQDLPVFFERLKALDRHIKEQMYKQYKRKKLHPMGEGSEMTKEEFVESFSPKNPLISYDSEKGIWILTLNMLLFERIPEEELELSDEDKAGYQAAKEMAVEKLSIWEFLLRRAIKNGQAYSHEEYMKDPELLYKVAKLGGLRPSDITYKQRTVAGQVIDCLDEPRIFAGQYVKTEFAPRPVDFQGTLRLGAGRLQRECILLPNADVVGTQINYSDI